MSFLQVRHNVEVAHRLFELEGNKCQQIHGHSMWIEMKIHGHVDKHGLLEGLDFGAVKLEFRTFLDTNYDHHLLLNNKDPWAQPLYHLVAEDWVQADKPELGKQRGYSFVETSGGSLPGLKATPGDPTTENIARWIATWATSKFLLPVDVFVQETYVNGAGHSEKNGH